MNRRRNIVYVFADQLRYDTLGCTGNHVVRTPHIDAMARQGILMRNAFAATPLCSPYRGQLLTGRYSHANGVMCNEYKLRTDQATLAQSLSDAGYRTAFVGKLHLGSGPYTRERRLGFEDMLAYNNLHDYLNMEYWNNERGPIRPSGYVPRIETGLALQTIKRYRNETPDNPFALFMSWAPPHWTGWGNLERDYGCYPPEYDVYDPLTIDVPQNVPRALRPFERREMADYYAMTMSLDDCMGRLLAELKALGALDDTIVCFTSDHGDHLGAHGHGKPGDSWLAEDKRGSKGTPYEESVHIPFIMRCPGIVPAESQSDVFFNSVDVMPTLLSLCDVEIPHGVQGRDLSAAFRGRPLADPPDSVYLQHLGTGWPNRIRWMGLWRAVRTDRYTYARYKLPEGKKLLFDHRDDPLEMRNLAGKPEHAQLEACLEARLQRWIAATADPFDTGNRLGETRMLDLGQQLTSEEAYRLLPPEYAAAIEKYRPRA